eukprot:scaffold12828_cov112-Isochrysis_galbana.AAC.13
MAARLRSKRAESAVADDDLSKVASRATRTRKAHSTAPNSARARCVSACWPEAARESEAASSVIAS